MIGNEIFIEAIVIAEQIPPGRIRAASQGRGICKIRIMCCQRVISGMSSGEIGNVNRVDGAWHGGVIPVMFRTNGRSGEA